MSLFSQPGRAALAALSAVVLSTAGMLTLGAGPASAVTACTGTVGLEFVPGLTLSGQNSTVRELGNDGEAGAAACTVPLTSVTVRNVHVEIFGSCFASGLNGSPTQPPTAVLDYGDAAQDSVLELNAFAISASPSSASKQIVLGGRIRAGDPHGGESGTLTITSAADTTDCTTAGGLTSLVGPATLSLA